MKNLSRLMALLCALLLCLSTLAAAEVLPLADTLSSYEAALSAAQEQQEEQAAQEAAVAELYESFMASESFAELYVDKMLPAINDETGEGLALMQAFTEEQIGALANRARELFALIENPTEEDNWDLEDCLLTFTLLDNGSEAVVYAYEHGSTTFNADTTIGSVYINGDATWILNNNAVLSFDWTSGYSAAVYIDNGDTLTIKGVGSIKKYADGGYNLFDVRGTGKLIIEGTTNKDRIIIDCNGKDPKDYGAFYNHNGGSIELKNVTVKNFSIQDPGGMCYNANASTMTMDNVLVDNCDSTKQGGAIANYGTLTIKNSTIKNCDAPSGGGAIYHYSSGNLTIKNSTIDTCTSLGSRGYGGAIEYMGRSTTSKTEIKDSTIKNCQAKEGSAIMFVGYGPEQTDTNPDPSKGTILISNSTIEGCKSSGSYGGTLRTQGPTDCQLTIESCTIQENDSNVNGGGVYWNAAGTNSKLTITGTAANPTQILNNEAGERGGGAFLGGKEITIENTVIQGNSAPKGGGFCTSPYDYGKDTFNENCSVTIGNGAKILNNKASTIGGGVYMDIYGANMANGLTYSINVQGNAVIQGNEAPNGGGIAIKQYKKNDNYYNTNVTVSGGVISGNKATNGDGGAFYIDRQYGNNGNDKTLNVNITGGEIYGNTATGNGGAIYLADNASTSKAQVNISGGTIGGTAANTAKNGGAIYVNNGSVVMTGGTASKNTASTNGGAVYVNGGNFIMTSGTLDNNTATSNGGGVYVTGGEVTIGGVASFNDQGKVTSVSTCPGSSHAHPTLTNNKAQNGGAVAVNGSTPIMYCGTVSGNAATAKGGAVYVSGGGFTMKTGTMTKNSAVDGGAVYVSGGAFTMENGTLGGSAANKNTATNGGAVYVTGGEFLMTNGSINYNTASAQGGAVYMDGGNFTMYHGAANNNSAVQGGAVYVAGTSSIFKMESGNMNNNTASDDGGAIFAEGGTLHIGLENCPGGDDQSDHTAKGAVRHHPIMKQNEAADCGGGIAIVGSGVVHFYCGSATENKALYKGVGKNVFMNSGENGEFHLYDGADVGVPKDPDLVVIGGKLVDERKLSNSVQLIYYPDNEGTGTYSTGLATIDTWFNLPDGEYFFDAPIDQESRQEMIFVGWTAKGTGSASDSAHVRKEDDYVESGKQVHAQDNADTETNYAYDGNPDQKMHLYAIWAPPVSDITYAENVDFEKATNGSAPVEYVLKQGETEEDTGYSLTIPPLQMDGYVIVGWYLYQDLEQNANWGLEPQFKSGAGTDYEDLDYAALKSASPAQYFALSEPGASFTLPIGRAKFGDITLVADMVPAYGRLKIKKAGWQQNMDSNQTFVFHIKGKAKVSGMPNTDMTIVIPGNGETIIEHLPVGEYTVTELTEWSWRYTPVGANPKTATIENPSVTPVVEFTNSRTSDKWLDGNDYRDNKFGQIQ